MGEHRFPGREHHRFGFRDHDRFGFRGHRFAGGYGEHRFRRPLIIGRSIGFARPVYGPRFGRFHHRLSAEALGWPGMAMGIIIPTAYCVVPTGSAILHIREPSALPGLLQSKALQPFAPAPARLATDCRTRGGLTIPRKSTENLSAGKLTFYSPYTAHPSDCSDGKNNGTNSRCRR